MHPTHRLNTHYLINQIFDEFDEFDEINLDISMNVHSYSSVYDKLLDLHNIRASHPDASRYNNEISELERLKFKLGQLGTHLLELKLTVK